MLTISIQADTRRIKAVLGDLAHHQLPFAISVAINDLASQVQRGESALIQQTFKSPRPFTVKSVQRTLATKTLPVAMISIRPEVAKYLQPYETGGLHVLPGKALLDPVDIRLDQYGQLPQQAMARLKARRDIYIGPIKTRSGAVISGVWQRVALSKKGNARRKRVHGSTLYNAAQGALKLLIRFGNAVEVKTHLGFYDRAATIVKAGLPAAFEAAMQRALKSAKP
jgi:hypothetical protein